MNIIQEKNQVITTKKGKGKLSLLFGNVEWLIPIYAQGDKHTHCMEKEDIEDIPQDTGPCKLLTWSEDVTGHQETLGGNSSPEEFAKGQ